MSLGLSVCFRMMARPTFTESLQSTRHCCVSHVIIYLILPKSVVGRYCFEYLCHTDEETEAEKVSPIAKK